MTKQLLLLEVDRTGHNFGHKWQETIENDLTKIHESQTRTQKSHTGIEDKIFEQFTIPRPLLRHDVVHP